MFAGDGSRHQHDDGADCECLDLSEFFQRVIDAGQIVPPEFREPEQTPFPGIEFESSPRVPAATLEAWLWGIWVEIRRGVGSGGFGPGKITWGDLMAYQSFTGQPLSDWLVQMILQVDGAFLSAYRVPERK